MMKTEKPADRGNLSTGLERGVAKTKLCINPITRPSEIQLFGRFDRDTMNAVIITAREVSI